MIFEFKQLPMAKILDIKLSNIFVTLLLIMIGK
jgi:hypothetical protein